MIHRLFSLYHGSLCLVFSAFGIHTQYFVPPKMENKNRQLIEQAHTVGIHCKLSLSGQHLKASWISQQYVCQMLVCLLENALIERLRVSIVVQPAAVHLAPLRPISCRRTLDTAFATALLLTTLSDGCFRRSRIARMFCCTPSLGTS